MNTSYNDRLLARVNLPIPLDVLRELVSETYALDEPMDITPIPVGYEELNCLLETKKGKFVVKIFSKLKNLSEIRANITALVELHYADIPVPALIHNRQGSYLYQIPETPATYLCVMEYFNGKKFTEIPPTEDDIKAITSYMAKIHTLTFPTCAAYDMWLTIYLAHEFEDKQTYLDKKDLQLIEPIVLQVKNIEYEKLKKSIVHYDLHRDNVMKNSQGKYCIFDLASCDYNYTVFDLATFIALFCFDRTMTLNQMKSTYHIVLNEYEKYQPLSDYEISILPRLIQATYASNVLIPSYLQKTKTDESPDQTELYKTIGQHGLRILQTARL